MSDINYEREWYTSNRLLAEARDALDVSERAREEAERHESQLTQAVMDGIAELVAANERADQAEAAQQTAEDVADQAEQDMGQLAADLADAAAELAAARAGIERMGYAYIDGYTEGKRAGNSDFQGTMEGLRDDLRESDSDLAAVRAVIADMGDDAEWAFTYPGGVISVVTSEEDARYQAGASPGRGLSTRRVGPWVPVPDQTEEKK